MTRSTSPSRPSFVGDGEPPLVLQPHPAVSFHPRLFELSTEILEDHSFIHFSFSSFVIPIPRLTRERLTMSTVSETNKHLWIELFNERDVRSQRRQQHKEKNGYTRHPPEKPFSVYAWHRSLTHTSTRPQRIPSGRAFTEIVPIENYLTAMS